MRRRHGIEGSDEEQCQSQLVDVLNMYTENARKANEQGNNCRYRQSKEGKKRSTSLLHRSQRSKETSGIMLIE